MQPLEYKITFLLDGYSGRSRSFVVIAMDVTEAIEVATAALKGSEATLKTIENIRPRWADTYPSTSPDFLSKKAIEYYASRCP